VVVLDCDSNTSINTRPWQGMLEWLASTRVPGVACFCNEQEAGIYNRWIEPFIVRVDCATARFTTAQPFACAAREC
jgi:hypothetical protein